MSDADGLVEREVFRYDKLTRVLWVNGVAFSDDFFGMFRPGYHEIWDVRREGDSPLVTAERHECGPHYARLKKDSESRHELFEKIEALTAEVKRIKSEIADLEATAREGGP